MRVPGQTSNANCDGGAPGGDLRSVVHIRRRFPKLLVYAEIHQKFGLGEFDRVVLEAGKGDKGETNKLWNFWKYSGDGGL